MSEKRKVKKCCHETEGEMLRELGMILHTSPSIEKAYGAVVLWTHERTKTHDDRTEFAS